MTRVSAKRWLRALVFLLLFLAAAWFTGCSPALFWARRGHLTDIVSAMLPPDWSYTARILQPLLATVQMPTGIPVATVAVNGAENAAVLAAEMLALSDDGLKEQLRAMKDSMREGVEKKDAALQEKLKEL